MTKNVLFCTRKWIKFIDEANNSLFYDKVARFTRKEVTGLGLIR
jgi:hypothetical protein